MEKTERITIKLDADTKERFTAILEKNGQTASKIIRLKIQQYILMNEQRGKGWMGAELQRVQENMMHEDKETANDDTN